jgi:hypothetical protein
MAYKPLEKRVEAGFAKDGDREFGDQYLELILQTWRELQGALRRTVTGLVLLVVAFFILADADAVEFTLGPVKLTGVGGALVLAPAVASYLVYEHVILITATWRYAALRSAIIQQLHPNLYAEDLESPLMPGFASAWGNEPWRRIREGEPGRLGNALENLGPIIGLSLMLGGVGFLGYAYWHLFDEPDVGELAVACSLVFATFNVIRAGLTLFDELEATGATLID